MRRGAQALARRKWQRIITLPPIIPCTRTVLPPDMTRLPRNHLEGSIPHIVLSTGGEDALECLLRSPQLGLDDSEFTAETGTGRAPLCRSAVRPQGSPRA